MTLRSIDSFCPPGTQIKSPGGFSFDPRGITAIEAYGDADRPRLVIHTAGGFTTVEFYRNVDGGPPEVYAIMRAIQGAAA